MERIEALQTYHIEGYSNKQISFTYSEISKGTKVSKLKDMLFNEFVLTEKQSNILIKRIAKDYDVKIEEYLNLSDDGYADTSNISFYILGTIIICLAIANINTIPISTGAGILMLILRSLNSSEDA
jgi:hypothetical protein